jgi:antitoxin component YwqK of YwqJK toxin-antitoxin module
LKRNLVLPCFNGIRLTNRFSDWAGIYKTIYFVPFKMKRNSIFMNSGKVKYLFPFLILFIAITACHQTVRENYPSGKLMIEKTIKSQKLDGIYKMWYESGSVKQIALYHNDKMDGLLECWYANGTKELEEMYANGLKNGKARYWDEQGNLLEEKFFRNDSLDGLYKMWYYTGVLKIEGSYHSGLYNGKWLYYNDFGSKVGEGNFIDGAGTLTGFDGSGHKIHEVSYMKNKKQGNEIEYNLDGSIKETKVYNQDKIVKVIKGS